MLLGILGTQETIILLILVAVIYLFVRYATTPTVGLIFLVGGLAPLIYGINILNQVNEINGTLQGRLANTLMASYRDQVVEVQTTGMTYLACGITGIIVGIVLLATRRSKGPEVADNIASQHPSYNSEPQLDILQTTHSPSVNEKFSQLEKLGKLREQGVLSEEEFQLEKKKILG